MVAQISFEKGWVQRRARHLFTPGELVEALNVVPDEEGAVKTRLGHALLGSTAQADVHSLHTMYRADDTRVRYQGAGTVLSRDFASILTGLNGDPIEFASMKGNGEQTEYTFFANGQHALRMKDDGTNLTRWGIAAPTTAPSAVVGATKTQSIDTFNSVSIATDYTPTTCALTRDITNRQEGASALSMLMTAGQIGFAAKALATPLNLNLFSDGTASTDEDAIRFWIYVNGLSNLEGIQLALNYSTGTQLIDGYFITNLNMRALIQSDGVWTEFVVAKKDFLPAGSASGGWGAINGIHLISVATQGGSVTLKWDDLRLQGGYEIGSGVNPGQYRYKQVFIRKAAVTNVYGRFVNGTSTYTNQTGAPLDVVSTTPNDGHLVGGEFPFAEVIYTIIASAAGGTPVYEYAYWAGSWVTFTPDERPDFSAAGTTRLRFSFAAGPWQKATPTGITFSGLTNTERYWIRVRATTPPTLNGGQANPVRVFDSVVSTRGNGSTASAEVTVQNEPVTVTVTNPLLAGADLDAQITHVEVYRTVADNTGDNAVFLYDGDVAAGDTSFVSIQDDEDLAEILEIDNDRPPPFTALMEHQQRIFGLYEDRLYFSKVGFPESFPPQNYIPISTAGDLPIQIRQYDGIPYVWTSGRVFQILGADETTYYARPIQCPTGLGAKKSVERGERGIYFLGRDGNLWRLQGGGALNISDAHHYALFHGVTQNGIAPLNTAQSAQNTCVGAWHNLRFYFAYPSGSATAPDAMLVIDERTETWWRDSRAFRCLHYDRLGRQLVGSSGTTGQVVQLDIGTTDIGTAIPITVQPRDEDEQAIEHDKELVQCTVDALTSGVTLTIQAVLDYASTGTALGTMSSASRQQSAIGTAVGTTLRGKAIGYRLTASGVVTLYRLVPHVIIYPAVLTSYRSLPLDMGYPGPKILESLQLDLDLQSGTLTLVLYADGVIVQTRTHTTTGRTMVQMVASPLSGTIFQIGITCTGTFLLYPGTVTGWIPRPQVLRAYRTPAVDFGYPGPKLLENFFLDIDLISGTLTTNIYVDGSTTAAATINHTTTGRHLSPILTAAVSGTVFDISMTCTGTFQLYPGCVLQWLAKPLPMRTHTIQPTDLGWPGVKNIAAFYLDIELLSAGTVTVSWRKNGESTEQHHVAHDTVGRVRSQRHRLPASMCGRLMAVDFTSTADFLLWPGSVVEWAPLGQSHYQRTPLIASAVASHQLQSTNLLGQEAPTPPFRATQLPTSNVVQAA